MAEQQYDVSPERRKVLEENAKRRNFLRNEFMKQASNPFQHATGAGGAVRIMNLLAPDKGTDEGTDENPKEASSLQNSVDTIKVTHITKNHSANEKLNIVNETQTYFEGSTAKKITMLQNVLLPVAQFQDERVMPEGSFEGDNEHGATQYEEVDVDLHGAYCNLYGSEQTSEQQQDAIMFVNSHDVSHEEKYLHDLENNQLIDEEIIDPFEVDHDSDKDPEYFPDEENREEDSDDQYEKTDDINNEAAEDENPLEAVNMDNRSRKRRREEHRWRRNVIKSKRNRGEEYENWKRNVVQPRILKPPCADGCRLKCKTRMTDEERENIRKLYWKLGDVDKQREWILRFVLFKNKKRSTKTREHENEENVSSRRTFTYVYNLPKNEMDNIVVCQTFFLNTLSISHQIVKTVFKKKLEGEGANILKPDQRGKVRQNSRLTDEVKNSVKVHISSFPTIDSHYCRKSSSRKYLCSFLNIAKMYQLYTQFCVKEQLKPASEATYRHIFNYDFNLSFFIPKKDQCGLCNKYAQAVGEEKENMRPQMNSHTENKELARKEKESDKLKAKENPEFCSAVFDLEQVLQCPKAEISQLYYKRKLSTYNLTVFDLSTKEGFCYMWHQGIARRGACEIGSCLAKFLDMRIKTGVKEFSFFSDNCGGQNRNRFLFTLYLYFCNKYNVKITHKFLEVGHTQNEGDSIHSVIERSSKNVSVFCPSQWYSLVRAAAKRKPYLVYEICQEDILDLKDMLKNTTINWEHDTDGNKILWNAVRVVEVDPSMKSMIKIKESFADATTRLINVCQKKRKKITNNLENFAPKKLYHKSIPIPKLKYDDLKFLCKEKIIPAAYHDFYNSLVCGGNNGGEESDSD